MAPHDVDDAFDSGRTVRVGELLLLCLCPPVACALEVGCVFGRFPAPEALADGLDRGLVVGVVCAVLVVGGGMSEFVGHPLDGLMTVHAKVLFVPVSVGIGRLEAFLAVGVYEEVHSRGYHLRNVAEGLNGLFDLSARTAVGVHVTWNDFQAVVYGFPVGRLDIGPSTNISYYNHS